MISDKTKKTLETMHNCCISINYINETYDGFALGGCYRDSSETPWDWQACWPNKRILKRGVDRRR